MTDLGRVLGLFRAQVSWQIVRLGISLQVLQQRRSNGQQIAASKSLDLSNISEGSAHDLGVVAVLLVVVEDVSD